MRAIAILLSVIAANAGLRSTGRTIPRQMKPLGALVYWLFCCPPEGEAKRKFILDCTGCHQLDESHALLNGAARPRQKWSEDIARMLGFAGASTGFPVIAADRNAEQTASWLSNAQSAPDAARPEPLTTVRQLLDSAGFRITEYSLPEPADLPHDVAVDSTGLVVITGMFSHTMYTLDRRHAA